MLYLLVDVISVSIAGYPLHRVYRGTTSSGRRVDPTMSMKLPRLTFHEAPFYSSVSHRNSLCSVRCHKCEGNFGKRMDFFTFTLIYPCSDRKTKMYIYLGRIVKEDLVVLLTTNHHI